MAQDRINRSRHDVTVARAHPFVSVKSSIPVCPPPFQIVTHPATAPAAPQTLAKRLPASDEAAIFECSTGVGFTTELAAHGFCQSNVYFGRSIGITFGIRRFARVCSQPMRFPVPGAAANATALTATPSARARIRRRTARVLFLLFRGFCASSAAKRSFCSAFAVGFFVSVMFCFRYF